MNIALWIVQVLLALMFALAGFMKATQPLEKLAKNMGWVKDFGSTAVRLIGTVEILGALGLILPAATHILTWLTPVAATGLAITMVGAIVVHVQRKEYSGLGVNVILLLLSLFVAYGRFVLSPL